MGWEVVNTHCRLLFHEQLISFGNVGASTRMSKQHTTTINSTLTKMETTKLKRGDLSPCGTKRFWAYQAELSKKTGEKRQRWVPVEKFESYRRDCIEKQALCLARLDYKRMQEAKTKHLNIK